MAQVLARVRNTGVATDVINRHGDGLDEGVAARVAVQKKADGAVKGGCARRWGRGWARRRREL